jgi:hypothetical protein
MRDRRLHLWNWLAIIAGWGVLLAWIRSQGSPWSALIVVQHSIIGWGLFLGMAFAIARRFGPIVRGSGARAMLWSLLAIAVLVSLYLAWSHHRTTHELIFDRSFPYPDPAIWALERWFDARHPVPRGFLKYHGELPRVAFVLGMLIIAGVSVSGFLLGVLSKRCDRTGSEFGAPCEAQVPRHGSA